MREFLHRFKKMNKRPFIRIVVELTLDGKMSLKKGQSSRELYNYQSTELKVFTHQQRNLFDGILVGAETVRIDNPFLTVREIKVKKAPYRIIVSKSCDFQKNLHLFDRSVPTIVVTSKAADKNKIDNLKSIGVDIITCGEKEVNFIEMLTMLYQKDIYKLIVEGGPSILENFLQLEIVDEICIKYLPILVGGKDVPTFLPANADLKKGSLKVWTLLETQTLGNHVVCLYGRN